MRKPHGRFLVVLGLGLVVGLGLLGWGLFRPAGGINVILITVDTLRADHLGVYGYRRNTSPNIDRFAREGILFRQAFAHAPETNPSLSSLFTSHYPHETKVLRNIYRLPPGAVTLAEILRARGYRTAAVVSNASLKRGSGFEQGFDMYDDRMENLWPSEVVERVAPKTTQAAIEWLEGNAKQKQPFFLWVHYMDPHGPYTPPAPYSTMFVDHLTGGTPRLPINEGLSGKGGIPEYQQLGAHRDPAYYIAQYDGEIRFLDEALGKLFGKIRALGLFVNSLVIFTADHGEGMGEHDYYFAHSEFLYNGLIRVPLVLRLPGPSAGGQEVRVPVAQVDVLPTILEVVGLKAARAFRGQSLLTPKAVREIFAETHSGGSTRHALIVNGMKLIETRSEVSKYAFEGTKLIWSGGHYELYDLHNDFSETQNLMQEDIDAPVFTKAVDLTRRLQAIRQQDALALGDPVVWAMGEKLRKLKKQLRALGYVQ